MVFHERKGGGFREVEQVCLVAPRGGNVCSRCHSERTGSVELSPVPVVVVGEDVENESLLFVR